MKKNFLVYFCIAGIILLVLYSLFRISALRSFQFFGGLTARVRTENRVIALTFDDAPTQFSNEIVDLLDRKGIPATFYLIGANIEKYPSQTNYIIEKGHEIGNHSYSHQRFLMKSPAFIEEEVEKTNKYIRESGYAGEITFRPPYGKKLFALPWYLNRHGIKTITWDVEPDTYHSGDSAKIIEYTLEHTRPGSIILMHPFCETECEADRKALPQIIDALSSRGFKFVTVSELLKYNE